jgi:hypothetical protein
MTDRLYEAGLIVGHLTRALLDGTRDLSLIPDLVKRIVQEGLWEEYSDPRSGRKYGPFASFEEFVETPGRKGGLGATVQQLKDLCKRDTVALDAIDKACQHDTGRPSESVSNVNTLQSRPAGNTQSYALRRLRTQRPDLHAKVLLGALKPNAAMEEAGFRKKTRSIRMDDPDSAYRTIKGMMSPEARRHLGLLLLEDS